MKSIKKFLFVMAALAAVFSFVSCSNGDDDGGTGNNNGTVNNDNNSGNDSNNNTVTEPSVVATYESAEDDKILVFLDDRTWSITGSDHGNKVTWSRGTYLGDPATNGRIELKYTHSWDQDYLTEREISDSDGDERRISLGDLWIKYDYYDWNNYILFVRK